jgi:hypothetical protein
LSSGKHRGASYRPYAFAEHGALQTAEVHPREWFVGKS